MNATFRAAILTVLFLGSALTAPAQYSRAKPVHITNAGNCLPDYEISDKPDARAAFVASGLMTEQQFAYAASHCNLKTMPAGIRNDGEWYTSRQADIARYKAYYIGTMTEEAEDDEEEGFEAVLLWFPRQDNLHMPADLIPEQEGGFFMLTRPSEAYTGGHSAVVSSGGASPAPQSRPARMVTCGLCYGKGYTTTTASSSQQLTPNTYTQDRYGNVTSSKAGQSRTISSSTTTRCGRCGGSGKVQED